MNQNDFKAFSELLSAVADYYGKPLKSATIQLYWNAFAGFDFELIKRLLNEHVTVGKFMPTIAELLDILRVMDGRPSPEEAWSMVARSLNDEGVTIVWTEEMASAFGVALGLTEDRIAARMAFKEAYVGAVSAARKAGRQVRWMPSLGHDPAGREGPLIEAVNLGRLSVQHVRGLLPRLELNHNVLKLVKGKTEKALEHADQA